MRDVLAALAILAVTAGAGAETYPSRPIRMTVGFPAGGPTDMLARLVGQAIAERLDATVVIDNRPGAGGMIADDVVAKAAPDGYTLGMMSSAHSTNPSLYPKVPHDVVKDFASIALVAGGRFHAGRILNGGRAGDMLVFLLSDDAFVTNIKTASATGLRIPYAVLVRADELIE